MTTASILGLLTFLFLLGDAGCFVAVANSPRGQEIAPLWVSLLGIFSTTLAFFSFAVGAGVVVKVVVGFIARVFG